jgi:hypothetical protein
MGDLKISGKAWKKTEVNCSKAFANSIKKLIPHIAFYDKNFN